jgi:hypothetical protein
MANDRNVASVKAWETIRANERNMTEDMRQEVANKRREASNKAWATRRKQEQKKKKDSETAKKAWETRNFNKMPVRMKQMLVRLGKGKGDSNVKNKSESD